MPEENFFCSKPSNTVFAFSCLVLYLFIASAEVRADTGLILDQIVVTAQKSKQRLQQVPISMTTISSETINSLNIQTLGDLTEFVPNFSVTPDPIGDKINIRGIQSGIQAGFEQSVGTFVDGIYRGRAIQSRFAFLDLKRVEILRGPQGTLMGKNTIAGAVNITSNRPTKKFVSSISAARNFDFHEVEVQGVISGPITDSLRGRLFFLDRDKNKGHVENTFYNQDVPHSKDFAARLSLSLDVGDNTDVDFRTETTSFDHIGQPWEHIQAGSLSDIGVEDDFNYRTSAGANDSVLDFGSNGSLKGDAYETALTVRSRLESGELTVVAGHSAYDFERYLDADFSPIDGTRYDDTEDFEQKSLEIRFSAEIGDGFSYLAGLFYQQQNLELDGLLYILFDGGTYSVRDFLVDSCNAGLDSLLGSNYVNVADLSSLNPIGAFLDTAENVAANLGAGLGRGAELAVSCGFAAGFDPAIPGVPVGGNRYERMEQETETYSVFFKGDFQLSDSLDLSLGARFTNEEKKASQSVWSSNYAERNTEQTSDPFVQAITETVGEFTSHAYTPDDPGMTRDEDSFTWSANLMWRPSNNAMTYASVSTGFKAGGFNSFYGGDAGGAGDSSTDVAFEEEEVISYEIGGKLSVWGGRGEINTAIFRAEYDDLQVSVFTGGTTFEVQNAAEAVSQGVEVDSRWVLRDDINLQASLAYIDFEYKMFRNQACTSQQFINARQLAYEAALGDPANAALVALGYSNASCAAAGLNDLAGRTSENTPEWQASLSVDYFLDFDNGAELKTTLGVNWHDSVYRQADLDPASRQSAITKVNASILLTSPSANWDIALNIRNLTDREELLYVNDTGVFIGTSQSHSSEPRSFTLKARYQF